MPELRRDPILGRWNIIAAERAARPSDFKHEAPHKKGGFCPFDPGHEDKTPPEVLAYRDHGQPANSPGWRVRVVPNKFPALRIEGHLDKKGVGMYDRMQGIGAHEVIIETPEHRLSPVGLSPEHFTEVIAAYRDRLNDLMGDPRFKFGIVFKNVGEAAGASLEHTHSQLIVTPVVPNIIVRELRGALEYYNFRGRCIFCDILRQEREDGARVVVDDPDYLAFEPFASRFPFETWIIPTRHSSQFERITPHEMRRLADVLLNVLGRLESALEEPPYNYIVHSAPFRAHDAEVFRGVLGPPPVMEGDGLEHYHWHIEIIPRLTKIAGFEWGTGLYINPVPPETGAEYLRQASA
jgi:UDPglucose--hexose-1-phosphate uridylyltransferase